MKQITYISGKATRLEGDDIDTDRIIPARFLKCVTFEGLGANVFADDRQALNGRHPFDQPQNQGPRILIVDENFGSGSSREHAVPALMQHGIIAIIGKSFSEIFSGNAVGNGLPCVTVHEANHRQLVSLQFAEGVTDVSIDLVRMQISFENHGSTSCCGCEMPKASREKLITGKWDDLATCLLAGGKIEETARRIPYLVGKIGA